MPLDPSTLHVRDVDRGPARLTPPGPELTHQAFLALLRTAADLTADLADVFHASGLTWTQYNALRILRGAGDQPLTCSEVGQRLITRDADVTRLLDRLERRGWVVRARDDHDRRVVLARLTEAGRKALAELDDPVAQRHQQQLGHLGPDRLTDLIGLLGDVAEGASARRELP